MLGGYVTQTSSTPSKRQKTNGQYGGANLRMCPHCGRTFKRTEHLERHVRTHTKEKPFLCHCGAAFARRDLLTRHYRVAEHGEESQPSPEESAPEVESAPSSHPDPPNGAMGKQDIELRRVSSSNYGADVTPTFSDNRLPPPGHHPGHGGSAEADMAAAVSLSGMSVDPWTGQQQQHQPLPQPLQRPMPPGMQPPPMNHHQDNGFVDTRQYNAGLLTPQFFDGGIDFDPHFREFANFLDGVGLPAEWSPYFNGPGPERDADAIDPELKDDQEETNTPRSGQRTRAGTPFSSWLPSAPTGNKISTISDDYPRAIDPDTRPFKITEEQRMRLNTVLEKLSEIIDPSFKLPSRHALTRYVTSFFEGFHSHMPFIHAPTWYILDHSLELIFGIAAIGAQYCFEQRVSERLFFAGKAVLMERLSREADNFGQRTSSFIAMNSPATRSSASMNNGEQWDPVETVRAIITLMGYGSWESKASMVQEAFGMQGLLTHVLRDIGLDDVESQPSTPATGRNNGVSLDSQWRAWVERESSRRSKLIAFSFLHTHSIAYNVYPVLRSNEVNLRLPCSTKEWKAPNPMQWQIARNEVPDQQLYFQQALSILLKNKDSSAPLTPIPTPLGNYVLLHGLLQRIHIVRDLSLPVMSNAAALPAEEVEKLERGLRSWTSGWQQAPESSLDPNNENGPIPFTSSSLLALAYVRIYLHLGPYRQLESRDPNIIAKAIAQSPDIERSDGVIAALLYTAHMISIPVRLGVDRVARSQAFFWSVRHSLSSLDCSVLLSKWLAKLGHTMGTQPITDSEDRILHWVRSIVEEAYTVVDFDEDNQGLVDFRDPGNLSFAVLKIWAHFFKSNTQWALINIMGESLEKYRGILIQRKLKAGQQAS